MGGGVGPGRTLGRYVVESELGAGGFATVYRARDTVLDRPVALKVLDPAAHRNPTVARRFLHEGRAVARLDHAAIVPVYDAGEDDGLLWLAMRLVVGRSLGEALDGGRRFDHDEVGALVARIGPALDHAHALDVVHRDVKPSNILLEGDDPARAWLADFGIAATARTAGRYTTGALGTAAYMAPEQIRPSDVGPPADVYSLGCVAFELVTGRRPFPGEDHVALLMAHATQSLPPTGDAGLDRVFARAMAKAAADRPSSGGALAAELRAALDRSRGGAGSAGPSTQPLPPPPPARRAPPSPGPPGRRPPPPPPSPRPESAPSHPPTVAYPPPPEPARSQPPTVAYPARPAGPSPRGRGAAVRSLAVGVVVLAVAAGAVLVVSLTRGDDSGTRSCDDAGVCFTLPPGWAVGAVEPGRVSLERDGRPVAAYSHGPGASADPVAALDDADPAVCGAEARAARVGDTDGARCPGAGGGAAALTFAADRRWLVTVDAGVPEDEAEALFAGFEFG